MKEKIDRILIKLLKIITLFILIYITTWLCMESLNHKPFSDILIDLNVYRYYYEIINIFTPTILLLFIGMLFLVLPYSIISTYLGISFLVKYIKKKRNIARTVLIFFALSVFLLISFKTFPLTSRYVAIIYSNTNNIQNSEIKEFVQDNIKKDSFITYIVAYQGFPDDYNVKIKYDFFKTKNAFLSDSEFDFINNNFINMTDIDKLLTIIFLVLSIIVYAYFSKYIDKEYKILNDSNDKDTNEDRTEKAISKKAIIAFLIVIFCTISYAMYMMIRAQHELESKMSSIDITFNNNPTLHIKKEWNFENNVGIIINVGETRNGREYITIQKTTDGGLSYNLQNSEGLLVKEGWEALFIDENIGYINDPTIPEFEEKYKLYVTMDGGKTFKIANIIHPSSIKERHLLVDGVPYIENEKLILKVYTLNRTREQQRTYYEFYSDDKGLTWKIR